jgi:hypothetical protein
MVVVQESKLFTILDLPPDMQRVILGPLPLRQLVQLACLSKGLRNMCLERVQQRDAVVAARLESDFTTEFRQGLRPADTSLPQDLLVEPPVRESSSWPH